MTAHHQSLGRKMAGLKVVSQFRFNLRKVVHLGPPLGTLRKASRILNVFWEPPRICPIRIKHSSLYTFRLGFSGRRHVIALNVRPSVHNMQICFAIRSIFALPQACFQPSRVRKLGKWQQQSLGHAISSAHWRSI